VGRILGHQAHAERQPANTDDIIGQAPQSSREEAKAAIAAASEAFPAWRNTPAPARGRILGKAVQLCHERKEEIARTMTREEGRRSANRAAKCRRASTCSNTTPAHRFASKAEHRRAKCRTTFVYTLRQPLGVVSTITRGISRFASRCGRARPRS